MNAIEEAPKLLVSDLEDNPQSLYDPIGDARTYRKIQRYLFLCITEGRQKPDTVDWLYDLYKNQSDEEKVKFRSRIDLLANALYHFYEFLSPQKL